MDTSISFTIDNYTYYFSDVDILAKVKRRNGNVSMNYIAMHSSLIMSSAGHILKNRNVGIDISEQIKTCDIVVLE